MTDRPDLMTPNCPRCGAPAKRGCSPTFCREKGIGEIDPLWYTRDYSAPRWIMAPTPRWHTIVAVIFFLLVGLLPALALYRSHTPNPAPKVQKARTPNWPVQKAKPCPKGFHLRAGECDSDTPITRPKRNLSGIVEDARIASGLSCAGIDNHRNEAAWSDGHSSVVSTYADNGDQLRYAHPAPSGRTLEALKRAEDALGIGRAGRKVIIACA